jgi:hypothetical protein
MIPVREKQVEPLCKFGPGGDFVDAWEPKLSERPIVLAKLLDTAVDAITAAFGFKSNSADASSPLHRKVSCGGMKLTTPHLHPEKSGRVPLSSGFYPNEPTLHNTEKLNDAIENSTTQDSTDAAPAPAPANGSPFPGEPLLFPDLGRNGLRIKHKPKHRVRASRRAAKKGPAFRIPKQGSLFEGQLARARIA